MCGRYVIASKIEIIEKRFGVSANGLGDFEMNTNVSTGQQAPVITNEKPGETQLFNFGFSPSWAKKRSYVINARSEGDNNKENDPNFTGGKGIISKPFFKSSIRKKRCLVIADAFIEGPQEERLSKPYLVYLKEKNRPFAFAGLYDQWTNQETGEVFNTFAVITTVSNKLMQMIGHHRSPVILHPEEERVWLDSDAQLESVTSLLRPYPWQEMNAYPIDPLIKNPRANGLELLDPIGERILKEEEYNVVHDLKLEGMGMTRARKRAPE